MSPESESRIPPGTPTPELFDRLYAELHAMAASRMRGERDGHTLRPTALIHEAYLRIGGTDQGGRTPAEFLALAARAMRSVLVDYHRQRVTAKRLPPGLRLDLEHIAESYTDTGPDVLDIDAALTDLEHDAPQLAQLVEWRFFGGLSVEDCAEALQLSERQAYRRWRTARVALRRSLSAYDESRADADAAESCDD